MKVTGSKIFSIILFLAVASLMIPGYAIPQAYSESCISPPEGLVAWWPFDETTGTIAEDIIGTNDLTYVGTPVPVAGKVDGSIGFPANSYVEVTSTTNLEPEHITVEAWVKDTGLPGQFKYLFAKGLESNIGAASYAMYTGVSSGLYFYVAHGNSATLSPTIGGTSLWDRQWHHVAGTYDGSFVRLYVDGVEIGSGSPTNLPIDYTDVDKKNFVVGTYTQNSNSQQFRFQGLIIDELDIYDRALSQSEIQDIIDADSFGKCIPTPSVTCGEDTELVGTECLVSQELRDEISDLEIDLVAALDTIATLQDALSSALADLADALQTITTLEEQVEELGQPGPPVENQGNGKGIPAQGKNNKP